MGFRVGLSNSPPPLSYFSGKTKFRVVASLSNGRRVSISRAKSAKWISIRPSTRVHSARGSNFFFRRLFSSFRCLAPLHLTKLSPRASLVAAIKFAWKLFRVERPNLNSPPPGAPWDRYNPAECVCYFLIAQTISDNIDYRIFVLIRRDYRITQYNVKSRNRFG